jgi:competence protein ComFC
MSCNSFKLRLLNILFPIECAGCGQEDTWLCQDCLLKLPLAKNSTCFFCEKENSSGATCPACAANHDLDGVFVGTEYSNRVVGQLIRKLKYSFARELGETLGEIACLSWAKMVTAEKFHGLAWQNFIVTPIPLHQKRFNWRGFNQSAMIGEFFAGRFKLEYQELLLRTKYKTPQAKLGGAERKNNIDGCFAADGEIKWKNILLVDDVATTGSTLNEAAKTLKAAGANQVWALVIAKG